MRTAREPSIYTTLRKRKNLSKYWKILPIVLKLIKKCYFEKIQLTICLIIWKNSLHSSIESPLTSGLLVSIALMGRFYDPSFLAPRNSPPPPHAIKLDTFRYLRRLTVQLCIEDYKRVFFYNFFLQFIVCGTTRQNTIRDHS